MEKPKLHRSTTIFPPLHGAKRHSLTQEKSPEIFYRQRVNLPVATISTNQDSERGFGIQRCVIQPIRGGILRSQSQNQKGLTTVPLKPGTQLYAIPSGSFRVPAQQRGVPDPQISRAPAVVGGSHQKTALSEMYRVSLILIQKEIMQTRVLSPVGRSKTCKLFYSNFCIRA